MWFEFDVGAGKRVKGRPSEGVHLKSLAYRCRFLVHLDKKKSYWSIWLVIGPPGGTVVLPGIGAISAMLLSILSMFVPMYLLLM